MTGSTKQSPGCHRHHFPTRPLCRWSPPRVNMAFVVVHCAHKPFSLERPTRRCIRARTRVGTQKSFLATICSDSHPQQWKMIRRTLVLNMWKRCLQHLFRVHWHVIQMVTLALGLAVFQGTTTRRFFFLKRKNQSSLSILRLHHSGSLPDHVSHRW